MNPPRLHPREGFNESIIATGFWFMYEQTHAPTDVRQHEADRVDNQIDVMTKAFLGITVGCARCHDHKFDAISTRDYYALAGFLKSSRQQIALLDPHGKIAAAAERLNELRRAGNEPAARRGSAADRRGGSRICPLVAGGARSERRAIGQRRGGPIGLNSERLNAWVACAAKRLRSSKSAHPLYVWTRLKNRGRRIRRRSTLTRRANSRKSSLAAMTRTYLARRNGTATIRLPIGSSAAGRSGRVAGVNRGMGSVKQAARDRSSGRPRQRGIAKNLQGTVQSPTFVIPGPQLHIHVRGQRPGSADRGQLHDGRSPAAAVRRSDRQGRHRRQIQVDRHQGRSWQICRRASVFVGGRRRPAKLRSMRSCSPTVRRPTIRRARCCFPPWNRAADSPESLAAAYGNVWNETLKQWHADDLDAAAC